MRNVAQGEKRPSQLNLHEKNQNHLRGERPIHRNPGLRALAAKPVKRLASVSPTTIEIMTER